MSDAKPPKTASPAGDRIAKVLSRAGIASRRDAEKMIAEGRVRVNGKPIDSPALNVTASDRVSVDGKLLAPPEPPRLWLYHKPPGLVTSARDEKGRDTVFDGLPEDMPRVMSIGRLDLNSEGLLLLTNDGALKRRLELPSTGWARRYRVRINGSVSEEKLDLLRQGITVEGVNYLPMQVTFDRQQGANAWLTITLREGKNREIRRALAEVGVAVNRLLRISYGPFKLGTLAAGAVEEVPRRILRDQLGAAWPGDGDAAPKAPGKGPHKDANKGKPRTAKRDGATRRTPPDTGPAKPAGKSTGKPRTAGPKATAQPPKSTPKSTPKPPRGKPGR
jgi:23S rRNA pseudouridine2605 synthase